MTVLVITVHVVSALTALLAIYYVVKDLAADLVLLGAALLAALVWGLEGVVLLVQDLGGGTPPDRITLYGYALTGLMLPVAGIWLGVFERSRYGSLVIAVAVGTLIVLQVRLGQIWPAPYGVTSALGSGVGISGGAAA